MLHMFPVRKWVDFVQRENIHFWEVEVTEKPSCMVEEQKFLLNCIHFL